METETSTFYLQVREMTITLQDGAVLLSLHIDGPVVTGQMTEIECSSVRDY